MYQLENKYSKRYEFPSEWLVVASVLIVLGVCETLYRIWYRKEYDFGE